MSLRNEGDRLKLSIPDDVIFEKVDDNLVLLSLGGGTYYKLNGAGTRVWELMNELRDLEKVETALTEEFVGDPAQIKKDVAELLKDLKAHGLVEVADGE
jgi:hypothetical protein